jgi:hypothetical protein
MKVARRTFFKRVRKAVAAPLAGMKVATLRFHKRGLTHLALFTNSVESSPLPSRKIASRLQVSHRAALVELVGR